MNVFKKIKKFFSNEVSLDGEPIDLITPCKPKGEKFKIGAKLVVNKDMVLVMGTRSKVYEVIKEGEYQISSALIPTLANKLKLHKVDKSGKPKDSFYAESYFVKSEIDFLVNISNYRKLKFKQGPKSYFYVKFLGHATCKIANMEKFMTFLMKNLPKIKGDSAQFMLEYIFNENLTDKLDKVNFSKTDYENKEQALMDYILTQLQAYANCVGVECKSVDINFEIKEKNKDKKQKTQLSKEEKKVEKQLGDQVLENIEVPSVQPEGEVDMYDDEKPKKAKKNKKFVDLDLDTLYDDNESKICANCSEKNRKEAQSCFKCGTKFAEEE